MTLRTSVTHPLTIGTVRLDGGGSIGLTFCPGKRQTDGATGAWARDLATDLQAIVVWGAAAVVSLMEAQEFAALAVDGLGDAVELAGLSWYPLPIPDGGVPDDGFEDAWCHAGLRLRQILRCGGAVVLHCKGGLGRTGMIAARLLVELGWAPEAAVVAVRAARPGAIETAAQEAHVAACRPCDDAFADRALACLLGGALGDAFGYLVEFDYMPAIRGRYGPAGLTDFAEGRLVVSDDTQMALFTLEGLLEADVAAPLPVRIDAIRRAYLDWYATQRGGRPDGVGGLRRYPELWADRAPGRTCLTALLRGGRGTVARPINDSKGCGGVMRVAPIGLVRSDGVETCFRLGAASAAQTHGHPSGYLPAGAMAAMIRMIVDGLPLAEAARRALVMLKAWPGHMETAAAITRALERAASPAPASDIPALGKGWVGEEALAIGLYSALVSGDFQSALRIAANHDGDSDSTASIAGQFYGAAHGLAEIPQQLVRRLDVIAPLLWLSRRLLAAV